MRTLNHVSFMRAKPSNQPEKVLLEVGPGETDMLSKPSTAANQPLFRLKSILVPVDFSDSSRKALHYARAFAAQFQAEVCCLNVLEVPYTTGEFGLVVEAEAFQRELLELTRKKLTDFLQVESAPESTKSEVRLGVPYNEIVHAAEERQTDLIIIGTHGHAGIRRFLIGSTAERVVRHAHCPVLVVREHEHEFLTPSS